MSEEKKQNLVIEDLPKFDNLIKLYPFNGRSKFLIDKFYIIGYNYLNIYKLLIDNTPNCLNEDMEKEIKEPHKFNIDEEPYILNEFTSDYGKACLPNETILKMIYPKKLDFYYTSEENINTLKRSIVTISNINKINDFNKIEFTKDEFSQNFPKSYFVIFSSNPQSENNSKKSINGIAYIFYRKFTKHKIIDKRKFTYYIPYTFCITSEYPFFNSFYQLFKYIKKIYF